MSEHDRLLKAWTGHDSVWWFHRVQEHIWDSVIAGTDEIHPDCDVLEWIGNLLKDMLPEIDDEAGYDGNMRLAALIGIVLTNWVARLSRAKAYDPNRPLNLRRKALRSHQKIVMAVISAVTDEQKDHRYCPGQEWNPPYGPQARGGTFV